MGLIDGLAQAGASAVNGVLSYIGTRQTNKTNRRIAAEQNALNYKMFQDANAYNYSMWNRENWYNMPINQRKRLEEAGYNPAALLDAPQLGAASSPSGSVTPAPAVGYQYQSPISSIGPAMAEMSGTLKNLSEAKLLDKQSQNYEIDLMSQIDLRERQGLLSKSQADLFRQEYDLKNETWDELIKAAVNDNKMKQEEARKLSIANDIQEQYGSKVAEKELEKIAAEIALELEKGNTEKAQQKLMSIQGDQEKARTIIMRDQQRSEAAKNAQEIRESKKREQLIGSQTTGQDIKNYLDGLFGQNERSEDLRRKIAEGDIKSAEAFIKELEKGFYDGSKGKWVSGFTEFTKWLGENIGNLLPVLKSFSK